MRAASGPPLLPVTSIPCPPGSSSPAPYTAALGDVFDTFAGTGKLSMNNDIGRADRDIFRMMLTKSPSRATDRHFQRVGGDLQTAGGCRISSMLDLIDRPVTFDYGYNMLCPDCPGITFLAADVYHSEPDEAHVPCAHRGSNIHFGPAAMAPRNHRDPALDHQSLYSFAWFQVSAIPDWPRDAHPLPPSAVEFLTGTLSPAALLAARRIHENQALHLGAYEAAIETMLRRMAHQDDGGTLFYLYRVGLHPSGLTIEPGWRDENSEEISQITQDDLGGFNVVRYLNVVRESPGSISLGSGQVPSEPYSASRCRYVQSR